MNLHYEDDRVTLWHGDCIEVLSTLPDSSVDAVVCDPPYGLANTSPEQVADAIVRWVNGDRDYLPGGSGFMGKAWDAFVPPVAVWDECLRVLKPGGHVLAFAGSRTHDLMTLALRLAGFDIRDSIAWLYGSGFPKSLDVSKAIDKAAGVEFTARPAEGVGFMRADGRDGYNVTKNRLDRTGETTPDAERWQGWGTALKPAFEPIAVARKPLAGTVAQTVLQHGTGALNIDACRVASDGESLSRAVSGGGSFRFDGFATLAELEAAAAAGGTTPTGRDAAATLARFRKFQDAERTEPAGRWPTNVVLDDSQAAELDRQSGESVSRSGGGSGTHFSAGEPGVPTPERPRGGHDDSGGASRFFPTFRYEAKAPTSERPRYHKSALRLRDDLTPEQVDHVRARLAEVGVRVD